MWGLHRPKGWELSAEYAQDPVKLRAAGGKPIWDAWIAEASGNGVPAKELFGLIEKTAKGG